MDERDEVHEALTDTVRTGATVLTQIAAQVARSGEARAADSARRAERDARDLQDRAAAARDAARLSYATVTDPAWWDRARPEQIADAYAAATAWRGSDPVAEHAVPVLERELHARYGIDPADVITVGSRDTTREFPVQRTSAAAEAVAITAVLDAAAVLDGVQAAAGQAAAAAQADRDIVAGIVRHTTDIAAGRTARASEASTAPVAPTAERDRLKRRFGQTGQDLPPRAVEARLTAAYGEGRPATDIRVAGGAIAAPEATHALEQRVQRHRRL